MRIYLVLVSIALFAFSCKSGEKSTKTETTNQSILGSGWELVEAFGEPIVLPDRSNIPYLAFNVGDLAVTGSTACNKLFGNYYMGEDAFGFAEIASSEMYCESTAEIERTMLNVMNQTNNYKVIGETLEFYSGDKMIAKFTKMAQVPEF